MQFLTTEMQGVSVRFYTHQEMRIIVMQKQKDFVLSAVLKR